MPALFESGTENINVGGPDPLPDVASAALAAPTTASSPQVDYISLKFDNDRAAPDFGFFAISSVLTLITRCLHLQGYGPARTESKCLIPEQCTCYLYHYAGGCYSLSSMSSLINPIVLTGRLTYWDRFVEWRTTPHPPVVWIPAKSRD